MDAALPGDGPLARIAAQAARRPHAVAIRFGGDTLGYARLVALARDLERELRGLGLTAGDSLGWLAYNQPRSIAALLACEAIGARCVPLNWRLAAPELAAVAVHAGLQQLWADDALRPLADAVRALAPLPQPRAPGHAPGDLMVVYTSGTTGTPKGAVHTGAGMAANIDAAVEVQGLDAATRALAVLPLFHVGGLCIQCLPVLATGGELLLQPRFDAAAWFDAVERERPTTSLLVPAVMRALVEHPRWPDADLSALRFVNSGSQIVPLPLIEAFHARGVPVAQVYGATETGPLSIALHADEALAHAGSVGRPARGVELRLERGDGAEAAAGEVGEILLRAPQLMRGYHREPPLQGWFRSGDLGVRDAQGFVTVIGRSKELIISGGENIYPAEIENLLVGHPDVADAVVVGVPDARWGEVPVLVLQPRAGRTPDLAALRALFEQRLAGYKRPRRIELRAELPRTALGKVRKADLAAGLAAKPAGDASPAPARDLPSA